MVSKIKARLAGEESGFTLIELLVVIVILGILVAIAVPSYLSLRGSAQDAAALVTAGVITVLILPALAVRWPHVAAEVRSAPLPPLRPAPPAMEPRTAEEGEAL